VARLATTYSRWLAAAGTLTSGLSGDERRAVFGATATRVYRLAD
jgi:predicted TIM-barrel fold metal-dependent hydrolase